MGSTKIEEILPKAQQALRNGAWEEARSWFEAVIDAEESPEAYDGLATCCRFIGALDESLQARENALRLFRERGDMASAVIAAAWLGRDSAMPRGEESVARSWFSLARRMLADTDSIHAAGTLDYFEGQFALLGELDAPKAGDLGARARSAGRKCGDLDLEMQGLSLEGLALVAQGQVDEGWHLIEDAAAAVLGDQLSGADVAGWICCHLIYACERVSDTRRAAQWCAAMRGFCERWDLPGMFGMCRSHYGSILMHEGDWTGAEAEFLAAAELFAEAAPALGYEAIVRLCRLRLRQGRLDEVEALSGVLEDTSLSWIVLDTLAAVALERGEPEKAHRLLERYDRRMTERDRMQRVDAMELGVRVAIAREDLDTARALADGLADLANLATTGRLRALAELCRGRVLTRSDPEAARNTLENALDEANAAGAPFEAASARAALGTLLIELGELASARDELDAARETFGRLGAATEVARLDVLLRASAGSDHGLSERELDVARLVAGGLTNDAIAARLSVSAHTVHRHLANIRVKLGVDSKAAIASWAAKSE